MCVQSWSCADNTACVGLAACIRRKTEDSKTTPFTEKISSYKESHRLSLFALKQHTHIDNWDEIAGKRVIPMQAGTEERTQKRRRRLKITKQGEDNKSSRRKANQTENRATLHCFVVKNKKTQLYQPRPYY